MIVDDEEFCITAIKTMISIFGVDTKNHVDFCNNGYEAINLIKRAKELGVQYALILMDFSMPRMDGVEATEKIRALLEGQEQPKIMGLTGHVGDTFKQSGVKAGMTDIIYKPLYSHTLKLLLEKEQLI